MSLVGKYALEFVFTDNHSDDGTFDEIVRLATLDSRVRGLRFRRNFGFQRSILEGLRRARGDAAIGLDADLQDPPQPASGVPPSLGGEGNAVVDGFGKKRPDPWHINLARRLFYRVASG